MAKKEEVKMKKLSGTAQKAFNDLRAFYVKLDARGKSYMLDVIEYTFREHGENLFFKIMLVNDPGFIADDAYTDYLRVFAKPTENAALVIAGIEKWIKKWQSTGRKIKGECKFFLVLCEAMDAVPIDEWRAEIE